MWCPLPWTHLGVKNNGDLRMCSHSQSAGQGNTLLYNNQHILNITDLDREDVLNCDTLKDVRRKMLDGDWPTQCRRCEQESSVGSNSRDQWETERHLHSFTKAMALESTAPDGSVTGLKFQDFDLRIGNQCNLRCVMCFPGEASKWYDAHQEITGLDYFVVDDKVYDLGNSSSAFGWSKDKNNIDALIRSSNGLLKIKFGGGEPLLIKHHRYLLESLISSGYSRNMELEYSVNLTFFPPDLFTLWKQFKKIRICASIDALGPANDAIRYLSNWETVSDNIRMLDQSDDHISVFISTTISVLSLEHYGALLQWAADQRFKKINEHFSHMVYNPVYFNINILEPQHIDNILKSARSSISVGSISSKLNKKLDHYEKLYHRYRMPDDDAAEHRQRLVMVWQRFKDNQQQDWDSIFPHAAIAVNDWRDRYNV